MTTVTNTLTYPSGVALPGVAVTAQANARTYPGQAPQPVGAPISGVTDASGVWTLVLPANSTLTPAGSWYAITEQVGQAPVSYTIVVPAGTGSYQASTLQVAPPAGPFPPASAAGGARPYVFSLPGALTVSTGAARIYNDTGRTLTITAVRASVGTAPTGAALIVDVLKNATTIFTNQAHRPTIAIAGNTAKQTVIDVASVADGEYLTVNIAQVGSTIAGSDLTVQIELV